MRRRNIRVCNRNLALDHSRLARRKEDCKIAVTVRSNCGASDALILGWEQHETIGDIDLLKSDTHTAPILEVDDLHFAARIHQLVTKDKVCVRQGDRTDNAGSLEIYDEWLGIRN